MTFILDPITTIVPNVDKVPVANTTTAAKWATIDQVVSSSLQTGNYPVLIGTDTQADNCKLTVNGSISGTVTSGTVYNGGDNSPNFSIPSWVKKIIISFDNISLQSPVSRIQVRLGTTLALINSGYNGSNTTISKTNITAAVVDANFFGNGFSIQGLDAIANGHLTLTNISGTRWVASGTLSNNLSSGSYKYGTSMIAGNVDIGGDISRINISTDGSQIFNVGSKINVMYEG